jgi:hypothetical protein
MSEHSGEKGDSKSELDNVDLTSSARQSLEDAIYRLSDEPIDVPRDELYKNADKTKISEYMMLRNEYAKRLVLILSTAGASSLLSIVNNNQSVEIHNLATFLFLGLMAYGIVVTWKFSDTCDTIREKRRNIKFVIGDSDKPEIADYASTPEQRRQNVES